MSTAIVPIADLERYAHTFAASGMFGAKTKEQAMALLLLAQAEGVHPAIAMRDFDIIQGRPAKKAQAMHRSFIEAGGSIEWHERSDTKADATFSHPQGGSVRVSWDLERAKKAGLANKDMYGKYGRQMLSARVISEGCRTVYPAATSGLYVPEEVKHFGPEKAKDMGAAEVVRDEADDALKNLETIPPSAPQESSSAQSPSPNPAGPSFITIEQAMNLAQGLSECDPKAEADFLKSAKIPRLDELPAEQEGFDMYQGALDWIARRKAKKGAKAA